MILIIVTLLIFIFIANPGPPSMATGKTPANGTGSGRDGIGNIWWVGLLGP